METIEAKRGNWAAPCAIARRPPGTGTPPLGGSASRPKPAVLTIGVPRFQKSISTCPAGETESIVFGTVTEFDPEVCDPCELRAKCTAAVAGSGRTVSIAADERLQQRLRKHLATPRGRARLRERVGVEHKLAHLVRRQGRRARYRGTRKNLFDLRRASAVQNLEAIHRKVA